MSFVSFVLIVRSTRVVLPHAVQPASIHIADGTITRIADHADVAGGELTDFDDLVVSPGLVDTHVHVNEPGRTEWEGFDTATRAAAAGGVTTIVDMPLNSVPATTTVAALEAKRSAARGRCHVDVGFWGGVMPGNASDLDALVDAGVRGFKCFLVPSGVDEFPAVERDPICVRRYPSSRAAGCRFWSTRNRRRGLRAVTWVRHCRKTALPRRTRPTSPLDRPRRKSTRSA